MLTIHSVKIYLSFGRSLRSTRGQRMAADANVSTFTNENIALWSLVQKRYLTLLKPGISNKLQKQQSNKLEWNYVQRGTVKYKVNIDLFYSIAPNVQPLFVVDV